MELKLNLKLMIPVVSIVGYMYKNNYFNYIFC